MAAAMAGKRLSRATACGQRTTAAATAPVMCDHICDRMLRSAENSTRRQGDEHFAVVAVYQCEHVLLLLSGCRIECAHDVVGIGDVISTHLQYDVSRPQARFGGLSVG